MLVAEIIRLKGATVHAIGPEIFVAQAARQLVERRIGALLVLEGEAVVGVFSERDLVRAVGEAGASALDRPVADFMTREVIVAEPGETVDVLMARMTDRRVRHLPVIRGEEICGVVSIGDLVKQQIDAALREAESLKGYISAG